MLDVDAPTCWALALPPPWALPSRGRRGLTVYTRIGVPNVYFDLTREFNQHGAIAALASGQAVVYYRLAIMSKDGDWILRETREACERVRAVLSKHGATYRPAAPLDIRWLRGGWSSHFEYFDDAGRRIRCDFVSRPPRASLKAVESMFHAAGEDRLLVVDRNMLIRLKQTGRVKDYAVIGELARQLPPSSEIEWTTDVDRLLELASTSAGVQSNRPSVRAARSGAQRTAVVAALAQEIDRMQQSDRKRVAAYQKAAEEYLAEFRRLGLNGLPLAAGHEEACRIAQALLPEVLPAE